MWVGPQPTLPPQSETDGNFLKVSHKAPPSHVFTQTLYTAVLSVALPAVDAVTMVRVCRRYRRLPLEAFVKGHLRVVLRATTKVFDGWKKISVKKTQLIISVQTSVFSLFRVLFGALIWVNSSPLF